MSELNYDTFKTLEGQQVDVCDAAGQRVAMTVSAVDKYDMKSNQWLGWSVLLETDQPLSVVDGSYQIEHPAIGQPLLHLSAKSGAHYEIIVTEAHSDRTGVGEG
ncbi:DUF6916 family protein [Marinimicrobium locisalis]|uniref:DUF6916 family protein n=1 Tax=Marinimicrobium locisalis TaxID=546022 RepID=UPI0032215BE6